jgi:hypothetical protein
MSAVWFRARESLQHLGESPLLSMTQIGARLGVSPNLKWGYRL